MEKQLVILLFAFVSIANASSDSLFANDSLRTDSSSAIKYTLVLDVGYTPHVDDYTTAGPGWYPSLAVRIGIGTALVQSVSIYGYLDYCRFRGVVGEQFVDPQRLLPSSPVRNDIAFYASVTAFEFLVIGLGSYHTFSDQVSFVSLSSGGTSPWRGSGFSESRLFYIVGVEYHIHVAGDFFVPIGLYYRSSYLGVSGNSHGEGFPRLGLGMNF